VPRKSLSYEITRVTFTIVTTVTLLYSSRDLMGAETSPKFLGAASCASSGCHGGGGQNQNQFLVWSLRDFHSQRPFATLTTARSKQIADALQIKDPAADSRCTSCHAPLHEVPSALRGPGFQVSEAVSCESCHGPAEQWLRSHTRRDYNHANRVASGMRDLKNLYVRANTCVACHQTVAQPLLTAGHPALLFELDGQCVSQPKHWREKTNWHGAQAWLVGQAAALREMAWELTRDATGNENVSARANALLWLLGKLHESNANVPRLNTVSGDYSAVQTAADKLARAAAEITWSAEMTSSILSALAKTGPDFRDDLPKQQHALRAERLVLALDRLLASAPHPKADTHLNELFKLTQSLPDFDPARFSAALDQFKLALEKQVALPRLE
jgi:hypothetical protein